MHAICLVALLVVASAGDLSPRGGHIPMPDQPNWREYSTVRWKLTVEM